MLAEQLQRLGVRSCQTTRRGPFAFARYLGDTLLTPCQYEGEGKQLTMGRDDLPLDGYGVTLEPVRHKDLVLLLVVQGEYVSALDCLVEETKDVIYGDDPFRRLRGASNVCSTLSD